MATDPSPVPLPRALYRREVWVVFVLLLVGASVDAGALPGQLLALPAYLPMVPLDLFEAASGVSFGGLWGVVLAGTYYALSVALANGYVLLRGRPGGRTARAGNGH